MEQSALIIICVTAVITACLLIINKTLGNKDDPCLAIPEGNIYFYWEKQSKENMFPELWSKIKMINQEIKDMHVHYLDCVNIGTSAAKNIEIYWEYDIDEYIKLIKKIDVNNVIDIRYTDSKLMFSIKYPKNNYLKHPIIYSQSLPLKYRGNIDYILPVNSSTAPVQIKTNRGYLMLATLYYYVLYLNQNCLENGFVDSFLAKLPECMLRIKYKNITNHKYHSSFKLSFLAMEHEMKEKPKHSGFFMWARINVESLS